MGNPKKQSRFICCKCLTENMIGTGIQRNRRQREKAHKKDIYCLRCKTITKNIEVRYCDNYSDMMTDAIRLHDEYYDSKKVG